MRRYVRAIVYDLDPRPVELLTAQLSLWFSVVLLISDSPNRPQPWWAWSLWCFLSAALKVGGVMPTLVRFPAPPWARVVRVLGNLFGLTFWVVLACVLFLLARGGIAWGGYGMLAAAQAWALFRLTRRVGRAS